MKNKKQTQDALLEAIDIMIEQKLKKLKFNYYVDGVIQDGVEKNVKPKSRSNGKNVYSVLINGTIYKNIPSMNKWDYYKGDVVQILIKNGDWNNKFIVGISNHTKFPTAQQYNSIDKDGVEYPLICDNTTNLWIGALERKSAHHSGKTYISTGYNNSDKKGYPTIYVASPNEENNDGTIYDMMHSGNVLDYTYPVGSVYVSNTNTNPSGLLGGGSWELIDKEFSPLVAQGDTYFTINTDNVTSATFYFARANHSIYTKIFFINKVALNDSSCNIGVVNLAQLGVSSLTHKKYTNGFSDGGNGIIMTILDGDGTLDTVDVIGASENTIPAGVNCFAEFCHEISTENMLDSACDKFYWKRTK